MLNHKYLEQLTTAIKKILLFSKKNHVNCEVAANINIGLSVNVRMQNVDTVEFNNNKKIYITVYAAQNKGTVATTELDEQSLENAVTKAISIAKFTNSDPYAGLPDPSLITKNIIDLDLNHPENIDANYGINLAKNCELVALNYHPAIKNSDGAMFTYNSSFIAIGNSHDFIGAYPTTSYSLSCATIAEQYGNMQRDGDFTVARCLQDLISPEDLGRQAALQTVDRLGAKPIPTCKTRVLFTPKVASGLLANLIAAIAGSNICNKSSFLLDKLNNKIFPEFINIIDDPFVKRGLASASFDDDGIATKKQSIITNGVLNTYLLSNYFAKKLQMAPTGHAGGIHNLFIQSTDTDQSVIQKSNHSIQAVKSTTDRWAGCSNLIKQMNTGLIVTETIGHGVNLVTGDYSKGAFGFWVENGKIMHPVEEITIAGNLNDMFKNILAVGSDFDYQNNIITGSILIDNLTVAGS